MSFTIFWKENPSVPLVGIRTIQRYMPLTLRRQRRRLISLFSRTRTPLRSFSPSCRTKGTDRGGSPFPLPDLWPQLFSDVSCIALWISSEKILTRLYSVLHWFHKRLEANVKKPRENRCFQTVIVFSFSSFDNSNKCTVLLKIAARLITVSTSVNKEMWVKLSPLPGGGPGLTHHNSESGLAGKPCLLVNS